MLVCPPLAAGAAFLPDGAVDFLAAGADSVAADAFFFAGAAAGLDLVLDGPASSSDEAESRRAASIQQARPAVKNENILL